MLLNANVAFLGTPRVQILSGAQISSYFSISTSVGSIVLGLLLVRQSQTKDREKASDVVSIYKVRTICPKKLNMRNYQLGKFLEKQSSSSAWVRNPSHHVQLAICVTDVEVSDFI